MLNWLRSNILRTFRGRLALLYIALEFGILLFAAVLLYAALSHRVHQEVDEQLAEQGQGIASELERSPFYFWSGHLNEYASHYPGAIQLVAANGLVLFTSDRTLIDRGGDDVSAALGRTFNLDKPAFASTQSLLRKSNIRVIVIPIHRAGRVVAALMLGRSTADISAVFNLMYLIGGILGLISIFISSAAGYYMAKQALAPIQEITSTARAVAAGDLSRRLTSKTQDKEIRILVKVLNKMFQDLEASFVAQKRFTADASHELRLPLTILKGEIEVALRHPRTAEEYAQTLQQQLETIDRIERIVNDLLTLARADAGQLELVQEPVDLSLLLQEVGQQHLVLFAGQHIELDMDIDEGLEVMGDASHLERLLMNLLNNAYKHAPEGSTVRLAARSRDGIASISVSDQGAGIAPEQQSLLFDRFFRADDARCRKQGEGAGLGLAICKRIVEAHGGDIRVESVPGHGATFIVELPLLGPDPAHSRRLLAVMQQPSESDES
ncbi:MAG TPA: ATP-binding protein [Mariprofundaceae bacterium]|nr:ATP-binding protein [Mariprofundaceae bacterium]